MKLDTPEIAWHGKEPILSVDFSKIGSKWRLASAGADNDVKIWSIVSSEDHTEIEFLANLSRHTKAVNVVKFSPKEEILASGGDDSMIILWKLNSSADQNTNDIFMDTDDVQNKESWTFHKALRGHIEDVYDLSWSPDGNNLISGSVDNSAIIWDVVKGQKLVILKDHKHYVQGVCWDPLGQYVVTNSSDRSCRLYNPNSYRCCYNITKLLVNGSQKTTENGESFKQGKMFHDETMPSFFRRPSYSPDGSLLLVPAGRLDVGDQVVNTTYVFTRGSPNKPVLYLPSPQKATVAVQCCPILFELRQDNANSEDKSTTSLFKLHYRMVFAVATLDSILLYDTQQATPFAYIGNIHYAALTDVTWSNDGSMLVVSSSDGYCSIVHFKEGELGDPYNLSVKQVLERSSSPLPQNSDAPGKLSKKITSTPSAEKDGNEEKVDKPQSTNKKEPVGRISMFTVPMKITPTKPVSKVTPKRIALTPAPLKPPVVNPTSTESTAQTTQSVPSTGGPAAPKRVTLMPVQGQLNAGNSLVAKRISLTPAPLKSPDVNPTSTESTAQTTQSVTSTGGQAAPKRVTLIPVQGQLNAGNSSVTKRISLTPAPLKPSVVNLTATESTSQTIPSPAQTSQPVTSTEGSEPCPAAPKRVTLMPVQGQLNAGNSLVTNGASQIMPRRVPLMPAGNSQSDKSSDENKPTAQVAPRRVALTPVDSTGIANNTATKSQEPNSVPGHVSSNGDAPYVSMTSSGDNGTRDTSPMQTSTPPQTIPSTASRRIPLTTLVTDVAEGCTKGSAQPSHSTSVDQEVPQLVAKENTKSPVTQPTPVEKPDATVCVNSIQPRRVALTPAPMETQSPVPMVTNSASITSLGDKENNKIKQCPITNDQPQPRRVTITSLGSENTHVEQLQNSSKKSQAPRRPIPLEPKVIVLDD